jgi:hypothetical protein
MADIDVVPKQRAGGMMWWIVGVVALLLILWVVFGRRPSTVGSRLQPETWHTAVLDSVAVPGTLVRS